MLGALPDVVATAPVAFLAGVIVGFLAADRWRLVRRNGREDPP